MKTYSFRSDLPKMLQNQSVRAVSFPEIAAPERKQKLWASLQ